MKSFIVKLGRVKELKPGYKSAARIYVGDYFKIIKATLNERGIFEKVNSEVVLATSKIKNLEIKEDLVYITTENSLYFFEVL